MKIIKGKVNGCLYFCKLKQEYKYGCDNCCENFEKVDRNNDVIEKIYQDGKEYDDIAASPEVLLLISVVLVIIGMIMRVF